MDLCLLAYTAVNGGDFIVEPYKTGEKMIGAELIGFHLHDMKDVPEGFIFYDVNTKKGVYRSYYPSGKEHYTFEVKGNKKEGRYYELYENGTVKFHAIFLDGKIHGKLIHYSETGVAVSQISYQHGIMMGPARYFYETGPCKIQDIHEGRHNYSRTIWYENGIVKETYVVSQDKIVDLHRKYHENGKIAMVLRYNFDGLMDGRQYTYDTKGREIKSELWSAGKRVEEEN